MRIEKVRKLSLLRRVPVIDCSLSADMDFVLEVEDFEPLWYSQH